MDKIFPYLPSLTCIKIGCIIVARSYLSGGNMKKLLLVATMLSLSGCRRLSERVFHVITVSVAASPMRVDIGTKELDPLPPNAKADMYINLEVSRGYSTWPAYWSGPVRAINTRNGKSSLVAICYFNGGTSTNTVEVGEYYDGAPWVRCYAGS